MHERELATPFVALRTFRPDDTAAVVELWNRLFAGQRNYRPLTEGEFVPRILGCAAFDGAGLFLAATRTPDGRERLVGLAHAFKPAPRTGPYRIWEARHHLSLLAVDPAFRGQGIGSRLLQLAENWLYYCPVFVADHQAPCYGSIEGPRAPLFGSTERMGIQATDRDTIGFFARRGYAPVDPGDVSMVLPLDAPWPPPNPYNLAALGLHLETIDQRRPFGGREPAGRELYTLWAGSDDQPYGGVVLADAQRLLRAHISWYPVPAGATMALGSFWVAPDLRGHGLGSYLLDYGLHMMTQTSPRRVELHTHLTHHPRACAMYEGRGFQVDMAWVNLVKT